ncbi:putative carboxypeptidase S1 [Phaeosphaeria sp. MPI-PUGE-AT-0046c]|nr:putative carboxypeptidase S1 [Phaeosphaeria sp. MPI-PUGE-AT-0046c]
MSPFFNQLSIVTLGFAIFPVSIAAHSLPRTYPSAHEPDTLQTIKSDAFPGASISYKQTYICETTPGVRAFSGYVHLPDSMFDGFGGAASYNASMFFWYFESRKDPQNAPLSLYLGGGPGSTSLGGATAENGPCYINADSNSTRLNPWSWNNKVNMLYLDQPVQVGFSYDKLVPSVLDLLTGMVTPVNGNVASNSTSVAGLFPSQNVDHAPNTTANAAKVIWQSAQIWLQDFPEHNSTDDRISIWANSYGGHWGPGTMEHFQSQNRKIESGLLNSTHVRHLHLDTLGLTNACIDAKIEAPFYLEYAVNNTYGLQTISEDTYLEARNNLTKPGGCYDLIDQCHTLTAKYDARNTGTNEMVNAACSLATQYCYQFVQGAYTETSGRSPFDISLEKHSLFPPEYIIGYMSQDWVQRELGVPLNFTISASQITSLFFGVTGDPFKVTIDAINAVAEGGVKVALVFGDRDYRCNWLGGEAISMAMSYPSASTFRTAGYENISTTASSPSGVVRQHNKVSFSRVFNAGHAPGAYQPETVSGIFDRIMFDQDVATGTVDISSDSSYASKGPASSFGVKNELPSSPKNECYLWDVVNTCTDQEKMALASGTALVKDYILMT